MAEQVNYLDKPIREIPSIIVETASEGLQKVSDWTSDAKDWVISHKKEILTAIAVASLMASVIVTLIGLKMFAAGGSLFSITETQFWNWNNYQTVTELGITMSSATQGAFLALIGALNAQVTWNHLTKES